MGWREVIIQTVWDYTGCTDARSETTAAGIEDRLADMPASDRIDLAREMMAGTGMVVVMGDTTQTEEAGDEAPALYARRAAMLGDEG